MNLGGPSTAGFADRLRTVFFNAPVPSGCTFTMAKRLPPGCASCGQTAPLAALPIPSAFMEILGD